MIKLKIEKLKNTGHGMRKEGAKEYLVLGAFPGDEILASPYKEINKKVYAKIHKILKASKERISFPKEEPFFEDYAPWLFLNFSSENQTKNHFLQEAYPEAKRKETIFIPQQERAYRNKSSYAFLERKRKLFFAQYTRKNGKVEKIIQRENILIREEIRSIAKNLLNFLNEKKMKEKEIKYLIIRWSNTEKKAVAQILFTEKNRKKLKIKKREFEKILEREKQLKGILVSYSEAEQRRSFAQKHFYHLGDIVLTERLGENTYSYLPYHFFQIYPEAFLEILQDLYRELEKIPQRKRRRVFDLYAGIGLLGIHIAELVKEVYSFEQSPEANIYAEKNAKINGIQNFFAWEKDVVQIENNFSKEDILIIDPPRSGMKKRLKEKILKEKPKYIFYISCNLESQKNDYLFLEKKYQINFARTYNIFPRTPHFETLIVMERKTDD